MMKQQPFTQIKPRAKIPWLSYLPKKKERDYEDYIF
jgi:hypothetical protein